ncbi:MAG TPA: PAS domain S-box protein [Acidobacteriaceae bacterium]
MGQALTSRIARYGLVPVFIGFALLASSRLCSSFPHSVDYLFIAAVVATAWIGRRGPGLLAALIAPLVLDYFFLPPLHTIGISALAAPTICFFLPSALAAAWMSSTVSSARQTKALLEQSEEKFRRILFNLPDVAWTADQNGCLLYISPKVDSLLGYSSAQLRAAGLAFLFARVHPDDLGPVRQALHNLFAGHAPFDMEFRFQHQDGSWIWLQNRATSTYRKKGLTLADGVVSDISRRRWSELELQSKTAFLEAQANSTIDGILVVDDHGHRLLENRRFLDLFSIPAALVEGLDDQPVLRHVAEATKDPASFRAKVDHLYRHPSETSRDEVELKNGVILDRYSSAVRGKDDRYYGRIWAFRDITRQKRRETMLRQLSAAVEQSPVSVVITGVEGNIIYVNRKFTASTGYSLDELIGKNPRILNSGHSPRGMYDDLWSTLLQKKEWRGEFRNRRKNGELFWESATISPILDADGAITHFLAVKEDITERRALESDLRQARKLEGIGQLAAGIAHQIDTPAQFVTDNLVFLQDSCAAAFCLLEKYRAALLNAAPHVSAPVIEELAAIEQTHDFAFIRDEVPRAIAQSLDGTRRVAKIVQAVREFSHPDLAEKTAVDLNQGIASTITIARNEWKYVADMVTDLDQSLPPVLCFPGDVNEVVLKLIVNAAHAIQAKLNGNGKGQITVRTRVSGPFAEIAVSDTGTGIADQNRTRIFDPFFTSKDVGSGAGQGLSLAYSIVVRKHHGKIWFETTIGSGSTFFVQLPIHPAAPQET